MRIKSIKKFCEFAKITEDQFHGKEIIDANLYLCPLTAIPEGFKPRVNGWLDLSDLTKIPKGFEPIVSDSIFMDRVKVFPKWFKPVADIIEANSVQKIEEGFNPIVRRLKCEYLLSVPDNFNFKGEYLDFDLVTKVGKNFKPIVTENIYLMELKQIPMGFAPKCYVIRLDELHRHDEKAYYAIKQKAEVFRTKPRPIIKYKKGKKTYVLIDGQLDELLSQRGNVLMLKNIVKDEKHYAVTDGNGHYAHGKTIKEARESLLYKMADRDKSAYENIDTSKKMPFAKAIQMYRVITGACALGVKDFVDRKKLPKKPYSPKDIAKLTKGEYGHETFCNFFKINP